MDTPSSARSASISADTGLRNNASIHLTFKSIFWHNIAVHANLNGLSSCTFCATGQRIEGHLYQVKSLH